MNGPCMCGDTQCSSCGPAQGNWRCPLCNVWQDDGCEHFDESGEIKQEFRAAVAEIAAAEARADQEMAEELEALAKIEKVKEGK